MAVEKSKQSKHSLSQILVAAVLEIFPEAKFSFGSVTENGFFCDFDVTDGNTKKGISLADMKKITFEMQKIIKAGVPIITKEITVKDAINWCAENKQDYKLEILKELKQTNKLVTTTSLDPQLLGLSESDSIKKLKKINLYQVGRLEDISCQGSVDNTNQVGVFKLTKLSGVYWRETLIDLNFKGLLGLFSKTKMS